MSVILTVVSSDGELFYHSRGKLRSCRGNPNWRTDATQFKTMKYAVRVARKNYEVGIKYLSWEAAII